jgi:hypothetical protein
MSIPQSRTKLDVINSLWMSRYTDYGEHDDESTVGKEPEDGYRVKMWKYEADDVRGSYDPGLGNAMAPEIQHICAQMMP